MFKIKEHRPTRKLEFSSKSNFQFKNQTLSKDAVVSVLNKLWIDINQSVEKIPTEKYSKHS